MRSTATRSGRRGPGETSSVPVQRDEHRYRWTTRFPVTADGIREFAGAVHDFHPAHWSEDAAAGLGFPALVAPPVFSALVLARVQREILEVAGGYSARLLHADQVIDIGRPLQAGDLLGCDIHVETFRQFAEYDVVAIRGALTAADGAVVQTGSAALLTRTGERDAVLGALARRIALRGYVPVRGERAPEEPVEVTGSARVPATAVRFAELRCGLELPSRTVELGYPELIRYAAATGDPAPLRGAVTAPGMLELGLATGHVAGWLGDPGAVTRIRAQFAHRTHRRRVPATGTVPVTVGGRIDLLDPRERRATVALDLRAEGRPLFGYAAVEIRLP